MSRKGLIQGGFVIILLWLPSFSVFSDGELSRHGESLYLGVASCASSLCHGGASGRYETGAYRTWARESMHSRSLKTLLGMQAKAISTTLKRAKPPHKDPLCTDCHIEAPALAKRGEQYLEFDGIGCETCHGGAQAWIKIHAQGDVSRDELASLGMYPVWNVDSTIRLCLSCHKGDHGKSITHRLYSAGHPRLSFELVTFLENMPSHGSTPGSSDSLKAWDDFEIWAVSVISSAISDIDIIERHSVSGSALFPELALFYCDSCHRKSEINVNRMSKNKTSDYVGPGLSQINDANLMMAAAVMNRNERRHDDFLIAIRQLHKSSTIDMASVRRSLPIIRQYLEQSLADVRENPLTRVDKIKISESIFSDCSNGEYRYFSNAEQVFFAIEGVAIYFDIFNVFESEMDLLFSAVKSENEYMASDFNRHCVRMRDRFMRLISLPSSDAE